MILVLKQTLRHIVSAPVCLLFALLLAVCSCKSVEDKAPTEKAMYSVLYPQLLDTIITKEYVAEIQSVQNIEIRTRTKGYLERIYVDEGQAVKAGQLLFSLSQKAFKIDVQLAEAKIKGLWAEHRIAEVELKNSRLLAEKNIIGKTEVEMNSAKSDALLAQIDEAKGALALANYNLTYADIRAPFDGIINRIPLKVGSSLDEGSLLTKLSSNKDIFAYFNISEKDYLDLAVVPGNVDVNLLLANNQLHPLAGKIETSENEIERTTGTLAFRARFANPKQLLKHGASGKILVNRKVKAALLIPQKTTFEVQDNTYVFIVDDKGVIHQKPITVGASIGRSYIVKTGLTAKDAILFEGLQRVKDGDIIRVQVVQNSENMANNSNPSSN